MKFDDVGCNVTILVLLSTVLSNGDVDSCGDAYKQYVKQWWWQ